MSTDTPTPRAVLAQEAADAIYAYVAKVRELHPRMSYDIPLFSELRSKMVAAIRADERATLAASAGPLGTDAIGSAQRHLETTQEVDDAHRVWLDTRKHLVAVLTAYTALAAECARLNLLREEHEQMVIAAGERYDALLQHNVRYARDLAALRATVAEYARATKDLRDGDGMYYVTQERAMAPGIVTSWPAVIAHPTNVNGRLVRKQFHVASAARTRTPEEQG